jgi:cyclohexadieny/prephenate dehydrogenase
MTGKLAALWTALGSRAEAMDAAYHDQVLAITSHLPHLIAFSIVDTATNLASELQQEVIRYSAGGFRDFTRIAASDPTMWRDVFLYNREAVLDIIQRFNEDLTELQKAIRKGDGDMLFEVFSRTRAVRRGIIDAKQATQARYFTTEEPKKL